ncbi:anaphase-promoting complex subunit 2 [Trypanosoma conorhini]|uniref:Anaphase-promoting complex subunit 2 n=1 Tax=Trypanosoma conorhini TaxID=83891 RepID=A0A3R7MQ58_9TRYP|nr:anaphase-promoting complex subunit 2 [Trypanosoma conorhini]RNF06448.1 anaphase-promoting complex subunit 2 [Trypanosoma conorhini]
MSTGQLSVGKTVTLGETEAFANLFGFLEVIRRDGILAFADTRVAEARRYSETLAALATPPFNATVGELVVRKVFEAFANTSLVEYKRNMRDGREILALQSLQKAYRQTLLHLKHWCKKLNAMEFVSGFTVSLRCHLLQPDLLTDESPPEKEVLLQFLRGHGRKLLDEIEGMEGRATLMRGSQWQCDKVLEHLHELTLSSTPDIKMLWKSVLVECTLERIELLDDDLTARRIRSCMRWKDGVVDTFVRMALSPDPHNSDGRTEVNRWGEELEQLLLVSYGRKRIASLWDVVMAYPDSTPTLKDLRVCLRRCSDDTLQNELVQTAKQMLASELHRAGTRTEEILTTLIGTIHSLCVLFSKNDQGSVIFTIVDDTLEHLKKRKDCVSAVVQAITQPNADSVLNLSLHNFSPDSFSSVSTADDEESDEDLSPGPSQSCLSMHERPDVLRVLMSAISVTSLVEEYMKLLAFQLLEKKMHDFDTTTEEEVLERLKCAFGEDVLAPCVVMIRDIQASRRYTLHMKKAHGRASAGVTPQRRGRDWPLSLDILSTTSWPKLSVCLPAGETRPVPERYSPHPLFTPAMEDVVEEYKRMKVNQRLEWILSQGRVSLELTQKDTSTNTLVAVTYDLSLFSASLVLYVRDIALELGSPAPLTAVAERMEVKPHVLQQRLSHLFPSVLVSTDGNRSLSLQTNYVSTSNFTFAEAEESEGQPAGLSPDQVKMLLSMMTAMLKARGPCGANDIFNSIKMLGQFPGTLDDMKKLLRMFLKQGKLKLNEAELFTLPTS